METTLGVLFLVFVAGVSGLHSTQRAQDAPLVRVGYYAESLCPDCLSFSLSSMNDAVEKIGDIFELKYVPWGNAKLLSGGKFECQHGEMECLINTVDACVLHYYPERSQFWPFIYCMDLEQENQDLSVAETCANKYSMNWDNIKTCTQGSLGHQLELMYANVTASLIPPHTHTPWITINGKHNPRAEGFQLIQEICQAYTGSPRPSACP